MYVWVLLFLRKERQTTYVVTPPLHSVTFREMRICFIDYTTVNVAVVTGLCVRDVHKPLVEFNYLANGII